MTGVSPGKNFTIYVTHVEADGPLLRIWGQIDKKAATKIESMIYSMNENFQKGQGSVHCDTLLIPNTICCAYHDDGYYRAKITRCNVNHGTVLVNFIDYGNTEIVPYTSIRTLNDTKEGIELQTLPVVVTDFTLVNVLPYKNVWDPRTVEHIKLTLRYNEMPGIVCSVHKKKKMLRLCPNGSDFSEYMINGKMALPATIEDMLRVIDPPTCQPLMQQPSAYMHQQARPGRPFNQIYNQPENFYNNNFYQKPKYQPNYQRQHHENWRQQPPQQQLDVTPKPTGPNPSRSLEFTNSRSSQSLVFTSRVLEQHKKFQVLVSYVEDGPLKFAVQPREKLSELDNLMRRIQNYPVKPLSEPPIPSSVCLGRYSKDRLLRRAVVMSVIDTHQAKVFYIDYGSSEILSHSDIYDLPLEFANPSVLSVRFTLSSVRYLIVSDEMKKYFKNLVEGKHMLLEVVPPEDSPLYQCGHLYDDGKNVLDMLISQFPNCTENWPDARRLPRGSKKTVHISYVEACSKFYVQLDEDTKALEKLTATLGECIKTAPPVKPALIKPGYKCLAHCNVDKQWYRAKVIDTNGNQVVVHYVDFGNDEKISISSLRTVTGDILTRIPALAIHCVLDGFVDKPYVPEIDNKFEEMVLDKALELSVLDTSGNILIVDIYDRTRRPIIHISAELRIIVDNTNATGHRGEKTASPARRGRSDENDRSKSKDRSSPEKPKKSWKDEENEQKRHEIQNQRQTIQFATNSPHNERFNRDSTRNDRSNRDNVPRQDRNDNNERYNSNDQNNRYRDSRGNRSKPTSRMSKSDTGNSSEKAWSDKDSDTSSRSGSRRGDRGGSRGTGNRGRRDNFRGPREFDENDRNFKSPRQNNFNNNSGRTPRDQSGNNRRFNENRDKRPAKIDTCNSSNHSMSSKPQKLMIPPPNITLGAIKNCELVFIVNPLDFAVQLLPDVEELDVLMEKVAQIYETGGKIIPESLIKVNLDCVAQYSVDSKWYRARIESLNDSGVTVRFVDYGNAELVTFDKIKELEEEVSRLPAQSVRCKLIAAVEKNWDSNEIDTFSASLDMKLLEAEFIAQDDGIYQVLLREIVDGVPKDSYVNEQYSNGANLMKAKEESRNKSKELILGKKTPSAPEYASWNEKWKEPVYNVGDKQSVMVTWLMNPYNFYCQSLKTRSQFRKMMNEIQSTYTGRKPISESLEIGTAVMAVFAEDGALYRAEIIELNKLRGNIVRYIDFGNCAMVEPKKIFRVEKKFMELPKQAFNCTLKNVVPTSGSDWSKSNSHEIDKLFNVEKLECTFHEIDGDKYVVSLEVDNKDIAGIMVEMGLAEFATGPPLIQDSTEQSGVSGMNLVRIDISKLEGQYLRVKVSNVENPRQFHIQLPSAADSEERISNFMAETDPKVLPKLSQREIFLGSGCLIQTKSGWQRAVVINTCQTTGYDVRLIDTGAKLVIPMDCMLALPSQLAVMQNQAVECYVKDATSDSNAHPGFKEKLENQEVIIRIDSVDNNRLVVTLFDTFGQKIKCGSDEKIENICPLLPMPVIHTVNKVAASHINNSRSIFFQRLIDMDVIQVLLEELYAFYSTSGKILQVEEGKLCAAQSADGNWYRAKIIKSSGTGALVQYIDYGNTEDIPSEHLKELEPDFITKPQLSIEVSLSVTIKGTESEQLKMLKFYIMDQVLKASFYHVHNKWIAELENESGEKISEILSKLNLIDDQVKRTEIDPNEPEEMFVGGKYKIKVTHADNPAQFWIQRLRDISAIDDLQKKLQSEVSTYVNVEGIPEENLFCAAIYSGDRLWYRAEVIDADEEIATVRFVDIGNTDSIMLETKDQIKYLPDSMKSIKRYGIKCRLDLIPFVDEDWPEVVCKKFNSMISSVNYLDAIVIADGNPKRVELFIENTNIGDQLAVENLAVKYHGANNMVDEIVERELDPRSAFVSHINSPSEFWVQEEKFVNDLEIIADRFMVAAMEPKIDDVKDGMLCIAKFPEDQLWYRARVISHGDTGTNVIYIDYGNSAVSTEIRQIPEDLGMIPPLSRKCCLVLPEGLQQWSEKACEEFSKMADDGATIFILDVLEESETSKVRLILDGIDIAEPLRELCEKPVPVIEERLSPLGEENSPNVVVSHVVSPSEFWIQTDTEMAELEIMAEHLENAQSFLPLDTMEEGKICTALFPEDGKWYRAKILCHSESDIEVLYIDYGNSAITSELRALPEDIIKIPALAMFSSLKLPQDLECWSQEACEKFIELVQDGATMFEYEEIGEDDPSLISLSLNGKDVVEMLAPLCQKKKIVEIDVEQLQKEIDKNENLEDSAFQDTTENIVHDEEVIIIETESKQELIVNESGDVHLSQNESITGHTSSSTSGIETNAILEQSTMSSFSVKMDSSPETTLQKTETPTEGTTSSPVADTLDFIPETSIITTELTPDDIVELYSQPLSEKNGDEYLEDASQVGIDEIKSDATSADVLSDQGSVSHDAPEIQISTENTEIVEEVSEENVSVDKSSEDQKSAANQPSEIKDSESIPIETIISSENIKKELDNTPDETKSIVSEESNSEIKSKPDLTLDSSQTNDENQENTKCPSTPKTSHSEKIVADVIDHEPLNSEDQDEVLIIEAPSVSK